MSDNSRRDSAGFQSLFGRKKLPKFSKPEIPESMKKGMGQLSGFAKNMFTRTIESRVRAPEPSLDERDLDSLGYKKEMVSESDAIYYSSHSEDDIFSEPEAVMDSVFDEPVVGSGFEDVFEPAADVRDVYAEGSDDVLSYGSPMEAVADIEAPEVPVMWSEEDSFQLRDAEFDVNTEEPVMEAQDDYDSIRITDDFPKDTRLYDPTPMEAAAPSVHKSYEELFSNIQRGASGVVDVCVGTNVDGDIINVDCTPIETIPVYESADFMESVVKSVVRSTAVRVASEDIPEYLDESEEVMRLGAAPGQEAVEEKTFDDVPDVYVPPIQDFEEDAEAAAEPVWEVPGFAADAFAEMESVISYPEIEAEAPVSYVNDDAVSASIDSYPEPIWEVSDDAADAFACMMAATEEVGAEPVWEVDEETAEAFLAMGSTIEYPAPVVAALPEWDVADETADAFLAMGSTISYPKKVHIEPEWDVSAESAEAFTVMGSYISYPRREKPMAAWDVAEDITESYLGMESTIAYPKKVHVEPAWDVCADTADSFLAMESTIEYPKKVHIEPEWDVAEDITESYLGMESTIEFPKAVMEAPVWDVSDDASEAFVCLESTIRYPRPVVAALPEWDVSDAAVGAFAGYQELEEELNKQVVMATLASTIVVEELVPQPVEREDDFAASAHNSTGNCSVTDSAVADVLKINLKDNEEINKDNLEISPEPKTVRKTSFVFKDGKLQMVTSEPISIKEIEEDSMRVEFAESPEVQEESIRVPLEVEDAAEEIEEEYAGYPDIIPLPAAAQMYALPEPRILSKTVNGVRFTFGRTEKAKGTVRFSF